MAHFRSSILRLIDHFHLGIMISSSARRHSLLSAPRAICLPGENIIMILMWNIAITTYLPNPIYFKIQGLFFAVNWEKNIRSGVCSCKGRNCLILLLHFRCVWAYIYPKLWDNVIRDGVLYVSYQFSFENLRLASTKIPPGVYLKSFSLRKLDWKT